MCANSLDVLSPAVAKNQTNIQNSFNFTVENSKADTYNLSSTLGNSFYSGSRFSGSKNINYNMTVCNGTKDLSWEGAILNKKLWSDYNSNVTYPDPTLDLQFDDKTANLTLRGYTMTSPSCGEKAKFCPADVIVYAEIQITFSGKIDAYHSDKLETDGATPKWEKTVGYGNDTQSADKTNGSTRQERCGLPSLLICASSLLIAISYI